MIRKENRKLLYAFALGVIMSHEEDKRTIFKLLNAMEGEHEVP